MDAAIHAVGVVMDECIGRCLGSAACGVGAHADSVAGGDIKVQAEFIQYN